ncbi:MAG: helix-turn-helix domain-containing protein, partial [bacterium]
DSPVPLDMGAALKSRRLARNITLQTMHNATRIPLKFLEALEAGRESDYPASVYVKGFVRSYCEFMEIDFEPFWGKFHPARPEPPVPGEPEKPRIFFLPQTPESLKTGFEILRTRLAGMQVRLTVFCAALVLAGLAWVMKSGPVVSGTPQNSGALRYPAKAEVAYGRLQAHALPPLRIRIKNRSWLRAENDGKLFFEGYAPAGAGLEIKASASYKIRLMNPDSVSLIYGNKPVPPEQIKNGVLQIP